jgi:hypothetical protein
MEKVAPSYWGNIIYESAMGLYCNEKEAKEESWMQEHSFPLYDQDVIDKLEAKLQEAVEFIVKYCGLHAVNCQCCMCKDLEKIKAK